MTEQTTLQILPADDDDEDNSLWGDNFDLDLKGRGLH